MRGKEAQGRVVSEAVAGQVVTELEVARRLGQTIGAFGWGAHHTPRAVGRTRALQVVGAVNVNRVCSRRQVVFGPQHKM